MANSQRRVILTGDETLPNIVKLIYHVIPIPKVDRRVARSSIQTMMIGPYNRRIWHDIEGLIMNVILVNHWRGKARSIIKRPRKKPIVNRWAGIYEWPERHEIISKGVDYSSRSGGGGWTALCASGNRDRRCARVLSSV